MVDRVMLYSILLLLDTVFHLLLSSFIFFYHLLQAQTQSSISTHKEIPLETTMNNLTPEKIIEIEEFGEAEAHLNYFQCAPLEFSRPFRLEARRIGSLWVSIIPIVDSIRYNRIFGFGMFEPPTESMLDEAIAFFQNAGCKNYTIMVGTTAQPAPYLEWLTARGFTQSHRSWAKMYRGNEPPPAIRTDLRVEKIGIDQADAYASVVQSAFEMAHLYRPLIRGSVGRPGWHHYVAFDGKKPVVASSMFVNGDVAWLGFAGTLQTHRKRGGQNAMFARRIEDGLALGCKWFITETREDTPEHDNPSYRNMLRIGFKLAYMQRCFYHQAPEDFVKRIHHSLFVGRYTLKFEWQRLIQQGRTVKD
jgi:hypothetical protein